MEADLLRRFRRGERAALESLYRSHVDHVEQVVRRGLARLVALSSDNLADLVQEVFLKAFSLPARSSYDGLREYAPYLFTIASNTVIDWARRSGREVPTADLVQAMDTAAPDADVALFAPGLVSLTSRYLGELSPELQAVHQRRFVLAESQRDAAKALGLSRQNLRTLERRLIVGLRREIRRSGHGSEPAYAMNDGLEAETRAEGLVSARRR